MRSRLAELLSSIGGVRGLAARVDAALLKPDAGLQDARRLLREAEELGLRAVILTPTLLHLLRDEVLSYRVRVGAVVGFPAGYGSAEARIKELEDVIAWGAVDADIVVNVQLLGVKPEWAINEARALTEICREQGVTSKLIVEAPLTVPRMMSEVERLIVEAKPDYIKTATGFFGSTTPEQVALLSKLGRVKAAGGVRTCTQALALIDVGAELIGTSTPRSVLDCSALGVS